MSDRKTLYTLLGLTCLLGVCVNASEETSSSASPSFEVLVSVLPADSQPIQLLGKRPIPGDFVCDARVVEAGTNRLYAAPSLVLSPGHPERVSIESKGFTITLRASITSTRDRAQTEVEVTRAGRVLAHQRANMWLPRAQSSATAFVQ